MRKLEFCFLLDNPTSGKWNSIHQITSKLQTCPNVVFFDRSKEYISTAGYGPCHTYLSILVKSINEHSTVTVKCRKSTKKALFLYFNLRLWFFHPILRHLSLQNDDLNMLLLDRNLFFIQVWCIYLHKMIILNVIAGP